MKTDQDKRSTLPGSHAKPATGKPAEKRLEPKSVSKPAQGAKKVDAKKAPRGN
jgi:hypothetical protein